ncbi:MAG: hypothetical protein HQL31_11530, partial [Planctomycetes bacterium]|nr:hypothetical protein [Planctomycetota bacterium]
LLAYFTMEAWARVRFYLNNAHMPADIRQNIGVNLFKAYRLRPNYLGVAPCGVEYRTDEHGFRTGAVSPADSVGTLVLGGDSRIFGLGIAYGQSVAGLLESRGKWKVYQQALPGGSPAFFLHQMVDLGNLDSLVHVPDRIVYAFDEEDFRNDREFAAEMAVEHGPFSPRRIKLALGGYLWSMLKIKFDSFRARSSDVKGDSLARLFGQDGKADKLSPLEGDRPALKIKEMELAPIDGMIRAAAARGMGFLLVYMPRAPDLLSRSCPLSVLLEEHLKGQRAEYLDLFRVLDRHCKGEEALVRELFFDYDEGIHFNVRGLELVSEAIQAALKESR